MVVCAWFSIFSCKRMIVMLNYPDLIEKLLPVAKTAGDAIMQVYERKRDFSLKEDGSPVTAADRAAEKIILTGINELNTGIAIVSEENPESHKLQAPEQFFLVDPLDGTKEFLRLDSKGGFTVNIALIEHGEPVMGIIYAPALDRIFYGSKNRHAYENNKRINVREAVQSEMIAVASRSHRDPKTDRWLKDHRINKTISIGSSLKFCLLACGEADVYPRHSPTMEWDTAAGDAILRAAGGSVTNSSDSLMQYGKPNYMNGYFVARGL